MNLGIFQVWRRQIWTDTCIEVGWKVTLGTKATSHNEVCLDNRDQEPATFLKQNIGWSRHFPWLDRWRIMLRKKPDETQLGEFKTWMGENYPGIDVDIDYAKMPRIRGRSIMASGLFLQVLVTVCLGGFTHFKIGTPSHAAWALIWLYGHPALRWTALIERSVFAAICRSRRVWFLFMLTKLLAWAVTFGVYGGIAVISVELLESVCHQIISLSPGIWVLVAALIFISYTAALTFIYFLPQMIGETSCLLNLLSRMDGEKG